MVEHRYWIDVMRFFIISGQDYSRGIGQPSPITKVQAIASTYFPEFELLILQLESASNQYEQWILDTGQKRVRNEPGYENLTGHNDVHAAIYRQATGIAHGAKKLCSAGVSIVQCSRECSRWLQVRLRKRFALDLCTERALMDQEVFSCA